MKSFSGHPGKQVLHIIPQHSPAPSGAATRFQDDEIQNKRLKTRFSFRISSWRPNQGRHQSPSTNNPKTS